MKVLIISAGFIAIFAMSLKLSLSISMTDIYAIWSIILSWLKPPYLYIIINCIILGIAASSRFHHSSQHHQSDHPTSPRSEHHLVSVKTPPQLSYATLMPTQPEEMIMRTILEVPSEETIIHETRHDPNMEYSKHVHIETEVEVEAEDDHSTIEVEVEAEDDKFDESMTFNYTKALPRQENIISPEFQHFESLLPVREKPLAMSRFGHGRKPIRSNPEVPSVRSALRVAKPKKHDTLESTWKMITEGRHVPLTRHLKKSDTFEPRHASPNVDNVPKSSTFKDRSGHEASHNKIRKEPSVGQDELNRRVEAFIKKINDDMRMQRQESINQYMEMINRGV